MTTQHRSGCAISSALDIVGDRWSLLIVRSMMLGARTYGDLLKMHERISTNILAERLKRLEAEGIIQGAGGRGGYVLTQKGVELLPVLQALAAWGQAHIPERWSLPDGFYQAVPANFL